MNKYIVIPILFAVLQLQAQDTTTSNCQRPDTLYEFTGTGFDAITIKEIKAISVKASSTLNVKSMAYQAQNIMDGDTTTAWVEGAKDFGKGEFVEFEYESQNDYPDIIGIMPGYAKDTNSWKNNYRVSMIKVSLYSLEDDERLLAEEVIVKLKMKNGKLPLRMQYVDLTPFHLHNMALTGFKWLRIEILEGEGKEAKYQDSCISEIVFLKGDQRIRNVSFKEYEKKFGN